MGRKRKRPETPVEETESQPHPSKRRKGKRKKGHDSRSRTSKQNASGEPDTAKRGKKSGERHRSRKSRKPDQTSSPMVPDDEEEAQDRASNPRAKSDVTDESNVGTAPERSRNRSKSSKQDKRRRRRDAGNEDEVEERRVKLRAAEAVQDNTKHRSRAKGDEGGRKRKISLMSMRMQEPPNQAQAAPAAEPGDSALSSPRVENEPPRSSRKEKRSTDRNRSRKEEKSSRSKASSSHHSKSKNRSRSVKHKSAAEGKNWLRGLRRERAVDFLDRLKRNVKNLKPNDKTDKEKKFKERIKEIVEEENSTGETSFVDTLSKHDVLASRIVTLERQKERVELKCKRMEAEAKRAKEAERRVAVLETERRSLEEDKVRLLRELHEVKEQYSNAAGGEAEKLKAELEVLVNKNKQLQDRAAEHRSEMDSARNAQKLAFENQLAKIREEHAAEIGRLKAELEELQLTHSSEAVVPNPAPLTPSNNDQPLSPNSAHRNVLVERLRDANAKRASETHKFNLQKRDIESLRASLAVQTKKAEQLRKSCALYRLLTGISVGAKDLFYECLAEKPGDGTKRLEFQLIVNEDEQNIMYEKGSWTAETSCPAFLDQSGLFFPKKLGPLFLKNIIENIFDQPPSPSPPRPTSPPREPPAEHQPPNPSTAAQHDQPPPPTDPTPS